MNTVRLPDFLEGSGDYETQVVGESSYQDALEHICGGRTDRGADEFVEALLTLEDSNTFDHNAVRVDINGLTVGYLSRDFAVHYRQRLAEAGYHSLVAHCRAHIRGGWDHSRGRSARGHFGVWLDLPAAYNSTQ